MLVFLHYRLVSWEKSNIIDRVITTCQKSRMLVPVSGLLRYWSTSISKETCCLPLVRGCFNPRISDAVGFAGWAGGFDVAGRSGTAGFSSELRTFSTINISAL